MEYQTVYAMKTSNALILVISLALIVALAFNASAQGMGEIRGTVTDSVSGAPLTDVVVSMQYKGYPKTSVTDEHGNYSFKPLEPGTYTISFQVFGKKPFNVSGIDVYADGIKFVDQQISSRTTLTEVKIKPDNIDMRKPPLILTLLPGDIAKNANGRDIGSMITGLPGIMPVSQNNKQLAIRGSRPDATQYYIDGVKVIGEPNIPQMGIEQVTVITGGLPAQYGDTTSGVVIITTKSYH